MNITATNPWPPDHNTSNNQSTTSGTNTIKRQHHASNVNTKNVGQTSTMKYETTKTFIPSPELIVDSSQSSESTENVVINNHRFVYPVRKKNKNLLFLNEI